IVMSCSLVAFAGAQNGVKNGQGQKPAPVATEQKNGTFTPATRLAVLNVERVMGECEQARDISMNMQEEFAKRQREIGKRVEEFQKLRKDGKITPAEAAKKESEFNIDAREIQVEFEGRSAEAQQILFASVQKAAEVVAQKHSIDAYIPRFLFAKEQVDLTGEVIAEMNRAYRAEKSASKFKAATPAKTAAPATPAPAKAKNA
ncbi:TPA: hypothetical protein DCW54_03200, partial [Candidatus Dependentiae bacterium]|nr:hypothetical protein [Candidatus Dependentiae bacterium]